MPTPRKKIVWLSVVPDLRKFSEGTNCAALSKDGREVWARVSPDNTETASGILCRFSERFWAVTTISPGTASSAFAAGASAGAAVWALAGALNAAVGVVGVVVTGVLIGMTNAEKLYGSTAFVVKMIAMVAGMMPSALAFGDGGEFRSPMALAVIGGLLFSTVLSLVFVPAMFMMMDDVGALFWRFGKKLLASSGEGEHDQEHPPAEHGAAHKPPPTIVRSPAAE